MQRISNLDVALIISATPNFWIAGMALRKLGEALRQLKVVVNTYIMLKELREEENSTLNHPTIHPSIRLGDLKIRCGAKDFRCDANSR